MKIVSIGLFRWDEKTAEPVMLAIEQEVSEFSYFTRSSVREMTKFFSRTFIKRTPRGKRQSVAHEEYLCHCFLRHDGLGAVVVADDEGGTWYGHTD